MRVSSAVRKRKFGKRFAVLVVCLCIFLVLFLAFPLKDAGPLLTEMAIGTVTDTVNIAINDAVIRIMSDEDVTYRELVTLEKDNNGEITAMFTNIARINILQSRISNEILCGLTDGEFTTIRIPIGNLFGSPFLSGRGPDIPIRILSVSSLTTGFRNDFAVAGINQTRHTIYLTVDVTVSVLLPGTITSETITSEVSIAETILIGTVPNAYAELGGT